MNSFFIILTLIIAPAAILLYYFWVRDRWEREPFKVMATLFCAGCLSVIPAVFIELGISFGTEIKSVGEAFFMAFIVAALVEELVKFGFTYLLTFKSTYFREEYDGIIYTVAVGLGFAFLENIGYAIAAFQETGEGLSTVIVRAFTAVPSHALDGVIMGFFLGQARFIEDAGQRRMTYVKGIILAILFHGFYDFFAFAMIPLPSAVQGWCVIGLIWILFVQWATAQRLLRTAQMRSCLQWGFQLHPTAEDLANPSRAGRVALSTPTLKSPDQPQPVRQSNGMPQDVINFCRFCGSRLDERANFCPNCGKKLR